MFALQNRWKIKNNIIVYYGLRNREHLFKDVFHLNKKQLSIINSLPKDLSPKEKRTIKKLIKEKIVVEQSELRKTPTSILDATFCKECAMNDYMIPGVEFDKDGLCPICQTKDILAKLKGVNPIVNKFPHSKKSPYDVAVFYTGGKDSSYLLYYLAKILNLRVLSLTWEIPYMSDSARQSLENAKKRLPNVTFITRKVDDNDLKQIYRKIYELNENTCACPSLAYIIFYPDLVKYKVPYFVLGNEPAQIAGLYYNHMAPAYAYSFAKNKFLNFLINIGRVLTLHPPYKSGQMQTLMTMKQLAYGDSKLKTLAGYNNELVTNVCAAIHSVPHIVEPLKKAIKSSSWSGNIPRFVQVDFDEIAGGEYNWKDVKQTIIDELGWEAPEDLQKGLHTSCKIEKCKEYSQFTRFYHMRSKIIPFSALEMSIASRNKCLTKEEAMKEISNSLGFSLEEVPECQIMKDYFQK